MNTASRAGLGVALIIAALVACSPTPEKQSSVPSPSGGCILSRLELGPEGFRPYGLARAGSLWFSAFGRVEPGAPAELAASGPYDGWKVVIHPDPGASGIVDLSGAGCSTDTAIRFCYGGCSWDTRRSAIVSLRVDLSDKGDRTGYMVFPGPGLMRLTVSKGGAVLGNVVISVPVTKTSS
jgi:hypothetical protein